MRGKLGNPSKGESGAFFHHGLASLEQIEVLSTGETSPPTTESGGSNNQELAINSPSKLGISEGILWVLERGKAR
jgi:hypothetical protein